MSFIDPRVTNRFNLPPSIFHSLAYNPYYGKPRDRNRISITELIDSPQVVWLRRKHDDDLARDAADRLMAWMGEAVHEMLTNAKRAFPERYVLEKRVKVQWGDWIITGRFDCFDLQANILEDLKITSVYSVLMGKKQIWHDQINAYAYLLRTCGYEMRDENGGLIGYEKLNPSMGRINAILRDHSNRKAMFDRNYPKIAEKTIDIPIWDDHKSHTFIEERLRLHAVARHAVETGQDLPIPECTSEDRWEIPSKYKVMLPGKKRSSRNLPTKQEAMEFITSKIAGGKNEFARANIIEEVGEQIRCQRFCPVRDWCPQYASKYALDPNTPPVPDAPPVPVPDGFDSL